MYRIQIGQIGGSQSAKKLVLGAITKKYKKKIKQRTTQMLPTWAIDRSQSE